MEHGYATQKFVYDIGFPVNIIPNSERDQAASFGLIYNPCFHILLVVLNAFGFVNTFALLIPSLAVYSYN